MRHSEIIVLSLKKRKEEMANLTVQKKKKNNVKEKISE